MRNQSAAEVTIALGRLIFRTSSQQPPEQVSQPERLRLLGSAELLHTKPSQVRVAQVLLLLPADRDKRSELKEIETECAGDAFTFVSLALSPFLCISLWH